MSYGHTSKLRRFLLLGLTGLTLAACELPPQPENLDYRINHKIKVASEQVAISITVPFEGNELSPTDAAKFKRFLRDYVQRSRTAVTVESKLPERTREVLTDLGLHDGELFIVTDTTVKAPNAVLSFTANKVISPECGDWSSSPSFNPSNGPHSNFGCATQRNISQTVADPGDFIKAAPAEGGNASRTDTGIFTHQSGAEKTRLLDGTGNIITGQ